MNTPILNGIRKQAGMANMLQRGLGYLSRNPRAGGAALGGVVGAGVGAVSGGDLKSTIAGAGIGTAAGYGAGRLGLNTRQLYSAPRRLLRRSMTNAPAVVA